LKIDGCEFPDDLLYSDDGSVWAKDESGLRRVGITAILSWLSGGFSRVTFAAEGSSVGRGRLLGSVEGPKHFDVIRAPFGCVVEGFNRKLQDEPRLLNRSTYKEGWFALLKPAGPISMKSGDEAHVVLSNRIRELRLHCFSAFPDLDMYEVGVECSAAIVRLNEILASAGEGTVVHVVSDDPTGPVEMTRWAEQTGNSLLETRPEGTLTHYIVRKD
jgi:glycine cleavage system H protein